MVLADPRDPEKVQALVLQVQVGCLEEEVRLLVKVARVHLVHLVLPMVREV